MKKEFIKLSAILCMITLVAGLLLAGVNKITAPEIAQAEHNASQEAMKKILPEADGFTAVNESVTLAKKGDKRIGFCVRVTVSGYGGDIVMMVGIGDKATVQGIEILSHSETAGLGAKITGDDFKKQFKDKNPVLGIVKGETNSPDYISAITGATISSRAVAKGVDEAFTLITESLKEAAK